MTVNNLYRITRPDGGTTVTPIMPTGMDYELMYRIIADEDMILVKGERKTPCADIEVEDLPNWHEEPYVEPENKK